jgi:hypothetical protein
MKSGATSCLSEGTERMCDCLRVRSLENLRYKQGTEILIGSISLWKMLKLKYLFAEKPSEWHH